MESASQLSTSSFKRSKDKGDNVTDLTLSIHLLCSFPVALARSAVGLELIIQIPDK